ncbi:CopG family transcriptional regulator [Paenibacillus sp. KN14-4R]|uniref:CopG family transcriptional regulator n=1 Tax=Paenibacillus sp. KN14-4R TaxID=3445773 RepID=UPI003F9F0BC8
MSETEKITINLGAVDLGQIDLLVEQGFYSNRTDLIRTAIRNQIHSHSDEIKQIVKEKSVVIGIQVLTKKELEDLRALRKEKIIKIVGMLIVEPDVPPSLFEETIDSIKVYGMIKAEPEIKKLLLK